MFEATDKKLLRTIVNAKNIDDNTVTKVNTSHFILDEARTRTRRCRNWYYVNMESGQTIVKHIKMIQKRDCSTYSVVSSLSVKVSTGMKRNMRKLPKYTNSRIFEDNDFEAEESRL